MTRLLLIFVALVSLSSSQTVPDPQFEGSLAVPVYQSGYVLDWDAPIYKEFTLYGPDTKRVYSLSGEDACLYASWAADRDGTVVRAGSLHPGKFQILDVSGTVTRTIQTGSYIPTRVTFAADHTIWTLGFLERYESKGEDFNVLRHYSRTGEELSQALPWSQIAGDYNAYTALQDIVGGRWLFAANDRLGFSLSAGTGRTKWIEVGFAGNLLGQYDLEPYPGLFIDPRGMTSSGDVYARIYEDQHVKGHAVLDKSKGVWHKVAAHPKGVLIGAEGDNLVFSQLDGGWTVLHQVAGSALVVRKAGLNLLADAAESN